MPNSLIQDLIFTLQPSAPIEATPIFLRAILHEKRLIYPDPVLLYGIEAFTPDFEVWFLRRERVYTSLKYSRTPAYDIVSGGVAALFAGFLGFLICEKFGFELLDSGDFYLLLFYGILLGLITRVVIFLLPTSGEGKLISDVVQFWLFFGTK